MAKREQGECAAVSLDGNNKGKPASEGASVAKGGRH